MFVEQVEAVEARPDVELVTITKESRDRDVQRVLETVRQRLGLGGGGGGGSRGGG